jgi:2-isopropylmalate synthase
MFWREYIERAKPWKLGAFRTTSENGKVSCDATVFRDSSQMHFAGQGNGPLAALVHGFGTNGIRFEITSYAEHALSSGEEAAAISYIQIKHADGKTRWGAGVDTNIELASVKAVLSALNRS